MQRIIFPDLVDRNWQEAIDEAEEIAKPLLKVQKFAAEAVAWIGEIESTPAKVAWLLLPPVMTLRCHCAPVT